MNTTVPPWSPILRPLRTPHPHIRSSLPCLPDKPTPSFIFTAPIVSPGKAHPPRSSAHPRGSRQWWKRMHTIQMTGEEDPEEEESSVGPFPDLAPCNSPKVPSILWMRKALEPVLQQSRPQNMIVPLNTNADPPRAIGYPAFELRFLELEKAGIIDGKGVWPEEQGGAAGARGAPAGLPPVASSESKKAPAGSL